MVFIYRERVESFLFWVLVMEIYKLWGIFVVFLFEEILMVLLCILSLIFIFKDKLMDLKKFTFERFKIRVLVM